MTTRSTAEFISYLKSLDIQVFVESDRDVSANEMRLRCNAPAGVLTAQLRQELVDRKAELLSYLSHAPSFYSSSTSTSSSPLSFAQQRLWFLYQLEPNNPFYNVPAAIRLTGSLNLKALERSFQEIVQRHAILRTRFTISEEQPVQVVEPQGNIELAVINLQTVALREHERISQQFATSEAQRPFNLEADPLLRVTLLQFSPEKSILLLTMHHIVADGWSLGVLIRELASCYSAFAAGKSPTLPALPLQYTDFTYWQRNWLQGEVLEEQLAYWHQQLQDLPVLELPGDRPRPAVQTYRGATYPIQIAPALTQALEALSQESGASLFMTLLAAFQTLLYRYTGQEDIVVGCPIANRHRSELEGLIGFFVNSLVLRADLSGNPTFRKFLAQVRNTALEAYEHQDLPFEKLVEELEPDRNLSRNPLFQVAFALQNAPMQPLELSGLTLEPAALESGSTRFDLEIHLWEPTHGLRSIWQSQEGLSGFISYSTDLFDRDRMSRFISHFQTLLEGIAANPDVRLSDLPLLTPVERQQILLEWNCHPLQPSTVAEQPIREELFHQFFEAHVQSNPTAIALVSEQGTFAYEELNQRANQLAYLLQRLGVQADTLVGLCGDRSTDLVIGILGILKAGGAYVPLDPNYPKERLHFMLTDTQVSILLTQSWLVEKLPQFTQKGTQAESPVKVLCLDQLDFTTCNAPVPLQTSKEDETPDRLAYVIYTSGTTGTPKGVLLTHRGLCNVVKAQQQVFHPSPNCRVLQFSSLSFDASVFEIALALGSGGTLYIPPSSAQLPGITLVQFLQDHAITHALLTPAVLSVLPSVDLPNLQVLITGGEACSSQVIDRWATNRQFFNAYGPTETTIWATIAELHPGANPSTIGFPIFNTQIYVLDNHSNPVPIGIPGELYIGGVGVARGYLNRPELTAEKFVENPFGDTPSRLYKTGDRAQYCSDGTIEFLGRVDHQIKIRGFRVELDEIEATLHHHPAIQDVAVLTSREATTEMSLVAYFSLNQQYFQKTALQSFETEQIQHWKSLYDQTYQTSSKTQNSIHKNPIKNSFSSIEEHFIQSTSTRHFDITGWNSSYSGKPISPEEMQEWVSDRVRQILALKPKRVLEIGCGTGLLLFQIAPHCKKYVATDFSKVSLESIQNQLNQFSLPQVELIHRLATNFAGIDLASFDVVILNSIVQYFPSQSYLMQVLEGAMQMLSPDGTLFIGDVRSLPLLKTFHAWMKFSQAAANMEQTQLRQQVERSQFEEPELVIEPAFFYALRDRFPQIQYVHVCLTRGHHHNEMTQFRYNVFLYLKKCSAEQNLLNLDSLTCKNTFKDAGKENYRDWQIDPITVEEVQKFLTQIEPEVLTITNVTNRRVSAAVKTTNWLGNRKAPKTVGRMREHLQNSVEWAIDPQDWWDLEAVIPYRVEITWSNQPETGNYDVFFILEGSDLRNNLSIAQQFHLSNHCYTNNPLQAQFTRQLIPELRHHLKQTLPDYMVPSTFVPLTTLPITTNGKIDRNSIKDLFYQISSVLRQNTNDLSNAKNASLSSTEITLIDIWKDLLQLKKVNIDENFFELGGHSLLATQMTSRVRDSFGLELPLKNVFEAPTIAQLASIIEALKETNFITTVPPITRLDRSAYRRGRSTLPSNQIEIQSLKPTIRTVAATSEVSTSSSRSPLVPLTLGNSKQPFFCVHPMFGVVFPYLELSHLLNSNRSFYGLQPPGLDGKSSPLNRIEAIAAYYIQAIQTIQPQGPYFLGGWSFGGLVAFEMAQQFTQAGQQVNLLAILDAPAPHSKPSFSQSLKFLLGTALLSTLPFLLDYGVLATSRLQPMKSWFSRRRWAAITQLISEESRLQLLNESAIGALLPIIYANSQAAYRYVAKPYPNRITLFKAVEQPPNLKHEPTLGWNALAHDIQLHSVSGNHLSLLKQPHVIDLAQQLGQYLS